MTDTGLNLVQRAMQYAAQDHVNLGQSAFVEIAEPIARTPLDAGAFVRPGAGGNEDVLQEALRGGLQVGFNPARCREEKILLPGNMEIETRNELRTIKRRLLLAVNQGAPDADYPKTVLITSALNYDDSGVLTHDQGVYLELSNGSRFGLTISAASRGHGDITALLPDTPTPATTTENP